MNNVTINFNEVYLNETSVVGGKNESLKYKDYFDYSVDENKIDQNSSERIEEYLLKTSLAILFKKTGDYNPQLFIGGDLSNQLSISSQVGMQLDGSLIGVYGACSNLILSLILAGVFISNRAVDNVVTFTSSSYSTSERQFRYPLNYANQKKETTTITTTGAASGYLSNKKDRIKMVRGTLGKIEDVGWSNVLDMGSPMAFACYKTLKAHFENTNTSPTDYDLIVTGDLSSLGSKILYEMFKYEGIDLYNHIDCGKMIFNENKKFFCGGSGCACIGLISFSYVRKMMEKGKYQRVILVGTGSLHSKISADQKEDIPVVAHLVELEVNNDLF